MQNITTIAELKNTIQLLEVEQAINGELLKEQFFLTYESLKPVNILKNTLKDIISSPYLTANIVDASIGLVTGFLSKKIFIGTSGNIIRKLLGTLLQFGVTNVVAKHPDPIKSVGQYILHKILPKKR